jgi:hypothetical protein
VRISLRSFAAIGLIFSLLGPATACRQMEVCGRTVLSEASIRKRVESYFEKQGRKLSDQRTVKATVKRDRCDYLYMEESLPLSPGAHFVMRLDRDGKVVEVLGGR